MKFLLIFLSFGLFSLSAALRPNGRESFSGKPEQLKRSAENTESYSSSPRGIAKESGPGVSNNKDNVSDKTKAENKKNIVCSHHFTSKYEVSYIVWSFPCSRTQAVCFSRSEIHKNKCRKGKLEVRKCNPESSEGVSINILTCENGCHSSGVRCRK